MNKVARFALGSVVALLGAFSTTDPLPAAQGRPAAPRPEVRGPERHDRSPALRDMPVIPPRREGREPHPPHRFRPDRRPTTPMTDPAAQTTLGPGAPTTTLTFEGISNIDGVAPPDTNGDIGPNHYVQWVNLSFAIYDRSGNILYGPADGSALWQGFNGACGTSNDGDPIVLYDHLADRWLLSQFALPNYPNGPYYQCIAVSATSDPLGGYWRYQFPFSKLNDYPKFGVWPDGYYMSINQFAYSGFPFGNFTWGGQGVAAFDRTAMLNGQTATMVYYDLFLFDPNLGGMLPSELDGAAPPSGSPAYFVTVDDDAWGYSPDQLQLWEFAANWANPNNTTLTKVKTLNTASFDSNMCGYDRACIPQPSTNAKLDAISDRLMYRLQYRNMGTHQSLVVNHTVDVNNTDLAGVRWYEVRNPGAGALIHQQGTFAPVDGLHRWMGSAAMDAAGNIAIGYNVSSSAARPSIRFTGRCAGDPLGQMTQGEGDLILGTGSQTSTHSRWGDYSMLALDPLDGRTFWFTTEYFQANGSTWRTRVGSFKLDACDAPPATPPSAPTTLVATASSSTQIGLTWQDNANNENGFHIERCTGDGCGNFAQIAQVGANTTSYGDSGLTANTSYSYRVRAFNAAGNSDYSNAGTATTQAAPPPPSSHIGDLDGSGSGQNNWSATVSVLVHDNNHAPVANATVSGSWSNGANGSGSCTTNGTGRCTINKGGIKKATTSVKFTVTAVTASGRPYTASANHDPEADSNGTAITINRQ